jgi:PAS domain-containing protein
MATALLGTVVLGLIVIFLSLEGYLFKLKSLETKKTEGDRIYKLSVIKAIQEKIAYVTDHEKIVNIIMISLRNFFNYSTASSMVIKNGRIVFNIYTEEKISEEHMRKIEENMLSSFEKLVGKLPEKIDKKTYGMPIDNTIKSTYLSSFHIPLIANNTVLALIHLSSIKANAFSNMEDLHELIDSASAALTHFSQSVSFETEKFSSLINSANDGILMADNKNNLLAINNSAKNILGISTNIDYFGIINILDKI